MEEERISHSPFCLWSRWKFFQAGSWSLRGCRADSEGIAKCLLASKWLISFNHWQQLRNYSWFSCWCPGAAKLLPTVKGIQLFLPSANAWHKGKLSDLILCQEIHPIHSAWGESPLWACCANCLHPDEADSSAPTLTAEVCAYSATSNWWIHLIPPLDGMQAP